MDIFMFCRQNFSVFRREQKEPWQSLSLSPLSLESLVTLQLLKTAVAHDNEYCLLYPELRGSEP